MDSRAVHPGAPRSSPDNLRSGPVSQKEEPENPDYPKNPEFRKKFGPRGVLRCWATDKDDPTEDMHYGRVGRQKIENTGPLDRKRMETVDEEFLAAAKEFIERKHKEGKPWFCYFNTTRMHIWTHLKPESQGRTGLGVYPDGMVETDGHIGQLLQLLDDLGAVDNTIVVYTTDNGAEVMSWPDGGSTPFRGEKDTNWEGAFRVPCVIRWPGVIKPGTIVNDICAHEDFAPTFAAAAGETQIVEKLSKGHEMGHRTFKVHLDGKNLLPFFKGEIQESPRKGFFDKWMGDRAFILVPAQAVVAEWLSGFREFPPRQKPASFNLDDVMEKLTAPRAA